jgi:hypothetical protein
VLVRESKELIVAVLSGLEHTVQHKITDIQQQLIIAIVPLIDKPVPCNMVRLYQSDISEEYDQLF